MKKQLHFECEWFTSKQADDYLTEFNIKLNRIIAEEVQKKMKDWYELIDFLLKDNTKRYALTRIFWTAFAISIIVNLILIYFLIK